jgi:hypothetical protein
MEPLHYKIENFDEHILIIYKKIAGKIFSRLNKKEKGKSEIVNEYENEDILINS